MINNLRVLTQLIQTVARAVFWNIMWWQPPKFRTYVYDYLLMPFIILLLLCVKSTWA